MDWRPVPMKGPLLNRQLMITCCRRTHAAGRTAATVVTVGIKWLQVVVMRNTIHMEVVLLQDGSSLTVQMADRGAMPRTISTPD